MFEENLVFGVWEEGNIYRVGGSDDAGEAINLKARVAFNRHPNGRSLKATAIRFDMEIVGSLEGRFGLDANYVPRAITISPATLASASASTLWGSPWGSDWSTSSQRRAEWFSTYGEGHSLGLAFEATSNVTTCNWFSCHLLTQISDRR